MDSSAAVWWSGENSGIFSPSHVADDGARFPRRRLFIRSGGVVRDQLASPGRLLCSMKECRKAMLRVTRLAKIAKKNLVI